jgi:hypothetical protein
MSKYRLHSSKHFGTFPFNHGRVGGMIATSRHGPHAHHGEDSVIVQASHVGYDPDAGIYGTYRRSRMETKTNSASCGKITHVITPYLDQYKFARALESIHRGQEYAGKNLLYIAGLNIDISEYHEYPATTYFVPWAAHIQLKDSDPAAYIHPLEQQEIFNKLMEQGIDNPDLVSLKEEIAKMMEAPHFDIRS